MFQKHLPCGTAFVRPCRKAVAPTANHPVKNGTDTPSAQRLDNTPPETKTPAAPARRERISGAFDYVTGHDSNDCRAFGKALDAIEEQGPLFGS